jgi:hypothetical protein
LGSPAASVVAVSSKPAIVVARRRFNNREFMRWILEMALGESGGAATIGWRGGARKHV